MFKFVIDLLTKGYNKKIITTKCATCEVEVPVIEEMKDEVNLCPKCGGILMQTDIINHINRCSYCKMLFATIENIKELCDECERTLKNAC